MQIRDGNTKVAHYCGKMVPPDFVSQARLVFVEFHSDFYINKRGFNATFTQMDGKHTPNQIYFAVTIFFDNGGVKTKSVKT